MTKYDLILTYAEGETEEGVCTIERSYPKVGVGQTLKQHLEYLAVTNTFQNLQNSNMGLNDKYNLTLTLAGQTEEKSVLLKGLTLMLVWAKY